MDSIRDMIVCGVNNNTVRARLLSDSEWSPETYIDICRAAEISSSHLKILTKLKVVHVVQSREEPDKLGTRKEEKEHMRAGTAGMNVRQFRGYSHKRGYFNMTSKSSMCLVISCSLQIPKAEPVRVSQGQAQKSLSTFTNPFQR